MRSLTVRLTLAFLAISLVGAALAALFSLWTTTREFNQFVLDQSRAEFVSQVTSYYQAHQSWQGIRDVMRPAQQPGQQRGAPPGPGSQQPQSPALFALADQRDSVILAAGRFHENEHLPPDEIARGVPIMVDNQQVGAVLTGGDPPALGPNQAQYLARSNQALLVGALGAAVVAIILGLLLARRLAHPLRELTAAIRAMARGELDQQVPIRSQDEIGELAASFNQMSSELLRVNQQRRQMTADIAHDLRTPLTVIAGYVESLRDGVLAPSPERFDIIHQEVQHLQHLVEDLRTLSLADAGELRLDLRPIAPQTLLESVTATFQHVADVQQVHLQAGAPGDPPEIRVDVERMREALGNLVSNSLRYTPPGGWIKLSAAQQTGTVVMTVADNGAGIAPEALPHIFERFYRADSSRQEKEGESGLGLAIARSIVEAHGGRISVASQPGQGAVFSIVLPCQT